MRTICRKSRPELQWNSATAARRVVADTHQSCWGWVQTAAIVVTAAVAAVVAVGGCSTSRGTLFVVDGVERNEASCAIPTPAWTVLASYGNLGYGTSIVEWSGGVRVQDVQDAFHKADGAADVQPSNPRQWEQVRSAVNDAVVETFPARSSQVTVRTAAGERKIAYELRCRYRVAMHRGDQRFSLDVEGGSGLWEAVSTPIDQDG